MNRNILLKLFSKQEIKYTLYNHLPLYTVEESKRLRGEIEGSHTKNLFLKNKKNQFFLFSCLEATQINLKKLQKKLKIGNVSFANNEYLKKILGVEPGSVTPFGLLNDINNEANFYLDEKILKFEKVVFHPLVNTSSIALLTADFLKFMKKNNKLVNIYNFDNYSLI